MYLRALNSTIVGEKIYFISSELNMVYSICLSNHTVSIVGSVPGEPVFGKYLFGNITACGNKLFIAPLYAEKIWVYEIVNDQWIGLECPGDNEKLERKFFGAVSYKNSVYLLGYNYPGVVKIDSDTLQLKELEIDKNIFKYSYEDDGFLNWDYVIENECLYTPVLCSNKILKIDLKTDRTEFISLGSETNKYVGITWDGEDLWLAPRKGLKFIRWDGKECVTEFTLPNDYEENRYYFGGAITNGKEIIFTSFEGKTLYFSSSDVNNYRISNEKIIFHQKLDDSLNFVQDDKGKICIINERERNEFSYFFEKETLNEYIKDKIKMNQEDFFLESTFFPVDNFCDACIRDRKIKKKAPVDVGNRIYYGL